MKQMNRRSFIKAGLATSALSLLPRSLQANNHADLVAVSNGSPVELVNQAIDALGGMGRFVQPGQTVLVKPNIGWDRVPEQAANTNPEIVARVVQLSFEAGAKTVRVLDRTCNQARRCYRRSGIQDAAKKAGAQVRHIIDSRFEKAEIARGQILDSWPIYRDALDADVLINIPIAKHHSISGVTLGFKNLMGLLGGNRGELHRQFAQKIVDINTVLRPDLTIVDGYRVLMRNGPTGGNLDDVALKKTVVAGIDPVAVDARAVSLLDVDWHELEYLRIAEERGLGICEPDAAKIRTIVL